MFSSWALAFSIWRRLVDSGHSGKRSTSGWKRKYDGRGEYKKAWSKSHKRILVKERFFLSLRGWTLLCTSTPDSAPLIFVITHSIYLMFLPCTNEFKKSFNLYNACNDKLLLKFLFLPGGDIPPKRLQALQKVLQSEFCNAIREVRLYFCGLDWITWLILVHELGSFSYVNSSSYRQLPNKTLWWRTYLNVMNIMKHFAQNLRLVLAKMYS